MSVAPRKQADMPSGHQCQGIQVLLASADAPVQTCGRADAVGVAGLEVAEHLAPVHSLAGGHDGGDRLVGAA